MKTNVKPNDKNERRRRSEKNLSDQERAPNASEAPQAANFTARRIPASSAIAIEFFLQAAIIE